jgi:hypothetical protein
MEPSVSKHQEVILPFRRIRDLLWPRMSTSRCLDWKTLVCNTAMLESILHETAASGPPLPYTRFPTL